MNTDFSFGIFMRFLLFGIKIHLPITSLMCKCSFFTPGTTDATSQYITLWNMSTVGILYAVADQHLTTSLDFIHNQQRWCRPTKRNGGGFSKQGKKHIQKWALKMWYLAFLFLGLAEYCYFFMTLLFWLQHIFAALFSCYGSLVKYFVFGPHFCYYIESLSPWVQKSLQDITWAEQHLCGQWGYKIISVPVESQD